MEAREDVAYTTTYMLILKFFPCIFDQQSCLNDVLNVLGNTGNLLKIKTCDSIYNNV